MTVRFLWEDGFLTLYLVLLAKSVLRFIDYLPPVKLQSEPHIYSHDDSFSHVPIFILASMVPPRTFQRLVRKILKRPQAKSKSVSG